MSEKKHNKTNEDIEKARRLEHFENLMEKHTRTERHLEQHSDIASYEQLEHAEELQQIREEQMDQLKKKILEGPSSDDEYENLNRNFEHTKGYLENNKDTMNPDTLKKTKEKQEHRKEQMDFLE